MTVDAIIWWTGVAAWCAAGIVGFALAVEWAVERVLRSFEFTKLFLHFAARHYSERAARRHNAKEVPDDR